MTRTKRTSVTFLISWLGSGGAETNRCLMDFHMAFQWLYIWPEAPSDD